MRKHLMACQVQKALSPSGGGNPAASLEEVVARLTRARVSCTCYLRSRWVAILAPMQEIRRADDALTVSICVLDARYRHTSSNCTSMAQVGKSYASPRTALLLNGNFVLSHLKAYDGRMGATSSLADTPFAAALRQEVWTSLQQYCMSNTA